MAVRLPYTYFLPMVRYAYLRHAVLGGLVPMTVAVAPQSWDNYKRVPPAHQAAMTGWVVVCEAWCGAMIHDVVVVVVAVWGVANGAVEPWRGSCIGIHRQRSVSDGRWYGGYIEGVLEVRV